MASPILCVLLSLMLPQTGYSRPAATPSEITSIEITSTWWGLGDSQHYATTIVQTENGYADGSTAVDTGLVLRLGRALARQPITTFDPSTIGKPKSWLLTNAHAALIDVARDDSMYRTHTRSQERLFTDQFTQLEVVEAALRDYYSKSEFHTDDYPNVNVLVKYADGTTTTAESHAQQLFMLPWAVTRGGKSSSTFDPELGIAIGALFPNGASNRWRLDPSDDEFRSTLAEKILYRVRDTWDRLGAADVLGEQLKPIEAMLSIDRSEISPGMGSNSIDIDDGTVWDADLRDKGLPKNVELHVDLPVRSGVLQNVGLFLQKVPAMERLVMSVPWFARYRAHHPKVVSKIEFALDRPASQKAQGGYASDLRSNGFGGLSSATAHQITSSCLVEVDEEPGSEEFSVWFVLPNRVMLPWYFRGASAAGFSIVQLRAQFNGYYYSNARILPGGSVEFADRKAPNTR